MCLAIYASQAADIPHDHIREGMKSNRDGAGFAYAERGQVHIVKGIWREKSMLRALQKVAHLPVAVHFRWATHGVVSKANCHPFRISDDCAVIHNGMLTGYGALASSDTEDFTRRELVPMYHRGELDDAEERLGLGYFIGAGNKLVILKGTGHAHIVNEDQGHWIGSVWYSNHSYLAAALQWGGSGGAWSRDDEEWAGWNYPLAVHGAASRDEVQDWRETSPGRYRYAPGEAVPSHSQTVDEYLANHDLR